MADQGHEIVGKDDSDTRNKMSKTRLAGYILFCGVWIAFGFSISGFLPLEPSQTSQVCALILEATGAAGVMLGLASLFDSRTQAPRRMKYCVGTLLVCIIGIVVFFVGFVGVRVLEIGNRMGCGSHMSTLGNVLYRYEGKNGKYPPADKWCDVLAEANYVDDRDLKCPSRFRGRSHYAMNPDCEPNCPNDTVLLFETKGGWNEYGGAELLTFDNHRGKGANVLFNDGHVEFIRPEDVGKLKWRPEDANTIR